MEERNSRNNFLEIQDVSKSKNEMNERHMHHDQFSVF
jgi:hypothetical protein